MCVCLPARTLVYRTYASCTPIHRSIVFHERKKNPEELRTHTDAICCGGEGRRSEAADSHGYPDELFGACHILAAVRMPDGR